ncbi:MAG TPA: FAD-dependent thymidylate synthase [Caldisericia bacterium]|nr:FAD-dependent thymidylate synthase [Caldisericia bacterium]
MDVFLLYITRNPEKIIELAGRTAYQSFERIKEGSEADFVRMLIRNGHESVLEHAHASFVIRGISRTCSHQLVRHRLCSFVQKSQRFVNESNFKYVIPPSISKNKEAKELFENTMKTLDEAYIQLKSLGIRNEDARFVLPEATCTEIVVTGNFRELRHIIKLRKHKSAQWEIREVTERMLAILKLFAPNVFGDL